MTKQMAYRKHYKMWDKLAANPGQEKQDLPEWEELENTYNACYLCSIHHDKRNNCVGCPLEKATRYNCYPLASWWSKWLLGYGDERIKYAFLIRDCVLPYLSTYSKTLLGLV